MDVLALIYGILAVIGFFVLLFLNTRTGERWLKSL